MAQYGIISPARGVGTIFQQKTRDKSKKGIIQKHLLNERYRSLYDKRKTPHTEFRFLPKELEMPTSTEIYKEKVIIFVMTPESLLAIMVESPEVATSFRKYFQVMWKTADHTRFSCIEGFAKIYRKLYI